MCKSVCSAGEVFGSVKRYAVEVRVCVLLVNPCLMAFIEDRLFPSAETGPRDLAPLRRDASALLSDGFGVVSETLSAGLRELSASAI